MEEIEKYINAIEGGELECSKEELWCMKNKFQSLIKVIEKVLGSG